MNIDYTLIFGLRGRDDDEIVFVGACLRSRMHTRFDDLMRRAKIGTWMANEKHINMIELTRIRCDNFRDAIPLRNEYIVALHPKFNVRHVPNETRGLGPFEVWNITSEQAAHRAGLTIDGNILIGEIIIRN